MIKKKSLVIALVVFVLAIVLLNFITVNFLGVPLSPVAMTGKVAQELGYVRIFVGDDFDITIHSPGNTTYDSDTYTCVEGESIKCGIGEYLLDLNVSANFFFENSSNWKYWLYDLRHDVSVWDEEIFTPNSSFPAVRWGNLLTVSAEVEDGDWVNQSVVFTIYVPNSAPIIEGLDEEIFVCESEYIQNLDASYFNVMDVDEEDFSSPDRRDINPKEPDLFSVEYIRDINDTVALFQIASNVLGKGSVGSYVRNVTIEDSEYLDLATTNITIIETNRAPVIYVGGIPDANGIGAQTIHEEGVDSVFVHQMNVSDVEDGWTADGNLSFNITSEHPGIAFDNTTGAMSYVPNIGEGKGRPTYKITVCATDNGLGYVPENFSICLAREHTASNRTVCDSFGLTITDENRPPSIDDYSPSNTSFTVPGTTTNLFSVNVSDPDMVNAYPDIDWYVDDVFQNGKGSENLSTDDFSWSVGCGVSGVYNVTIITSDGLLSNSSSWNITVTNVDCPVEVGGRAGAGGSGGGALGGLCNEQWSCSHWGLCQNAERSFDAEVLSFEDYSFTKDLCAQNQFDDRFCGFQITRCVDLRQCNNSELRIPSPPESRVCYFTEDPNCIDGITNCHDGDCELLMDCGGPCDPCPTCSDDKRNQGENGVDCGGPCPYACEAERAFSVISVVLVALLIALLVVGLFILWKLVNILRYRFFLKRKKR